MLRWVIDLGGWYNNFSGDEAGMASMGAFNFEIIGFWHQCICSVRNLAQAGYESGRQGDTLSQFNN